MSLTTPLKLLAKYLNLLCPRSQKLANIVEVTIKYILDFIMKNEGEHIKGSECDQKILSKGESSGSVVSPNYPYPYIQKTVCRYFVYGMQDAQHLERVRLEFLKFAIPKGEKGE